MLLAFAFVLFAIMLVSWFVAPTAEKSVPVAKDAQVAAPASAAMQH